MKKHLLFIIGLPIISMVCKFILGPLTTGAHDGGFLALFFGAICGFTIFTSIVLKINKTISILIGVIMGSLLVFTSDQLICLIFFDPNVEFWEVAYRDFWLNKLSIRNIDIAMYIGFFSIFISSCIILIEIIKRLTHKTTPNKL